MAAPPPVFAPAPADGPSAGVFGKIEAGVQQAIVPAAPMGGPMQHGLAQMGGAAAGAIGPSGQTRNPMMVLLISLICFLYGIYQFYVMLGELRDFLQSDEINPIHIFIPVLNILMLFKLPGWVLEAKQRAGVPNPEVGNVILYWFLGLYLLPKDLNEVWNPTGQLTA
ncbi:MAG: hypothetical protein MUF54_01905 [Polyangiaceae bacterium]|jgi:hypothetical protein|nr:hypothetical protein [Polyangiaceae bacterium]